MDYQQGSHPRRVVSEAVGAAASGANRGHIDRVLNGMSEEDIVRVAMQLGYEVDEEGHVWNPQVSTFALLKDEDRGS